MWNEPTYRYTDYLLLYIMLPEMSSKHIFMQKRAQRIYFSHKMRFICHVFVPKLESHVTCIQNNNSQRIRESSRQTLYCMLRYATLICFSLQFPSGLTRGSVVKWLFNSVKNMICEVKKPWLRLFWVLKNTDCYYHHLLLVSVSLFGASLGHCSHLWVTPSASTLTTHPVTPPSLPPEGHTPTGSCRLAPR